MKISLLINMKMPTIVVIFIFISRENFMLSLVKYEKSFITSGPDCGNVEAEPDLHSYLKIRLVIGIFFFLFLNESIYCGYSLTLVMLNKLRCHAHF